MQKFTVDEYLFRLLDIAYSCKTRYAWGAFGAPATKKNRERYNISEEISSNRFLFDCSGFAYKAIPWGWTGDKNKVNGGATYDASTDWSSDMILDHCTDVSTDFTKIVPGELVWMKGHVGIYIGKDEVVECTPKWTNGVLISVCKNINPNTKAVKSRKWTKHAKLPFIIYNEAPQYTTARFGEGLIKIAARCGITFEEIKRLNPNIKPPVYLVLVGQKVRIK